MKRWSKPRQPTTPQSRRTTRKPSVAAASTCAELRTQVDDLICLHHPGHFFAVGQFYRQFDQTTDDEVRTLLAEAQQPGDSPQAA